MTIIIGKESNLSRRLEEKLEGAVLISVREFLVDTTLLDQYRQEEVSIIFNNFQTATKLNDLSSPQQYVEQTIYSTAVILEKIKTFKIKKMIYVSSSSVYGNNKLCSESDGLQPMNLHASLKLSNEKLIEKYCLEHAIDFTIARVFNMYGGEDHFSVISKMISAYKNKQTFIVINEGESIRDFIHIDNVSDLLIKLLRIDNIPVINIGTGEKKSIKSILDFLSLHQIKIAIESRYLDEIKISIADNRLLNSVMGNIDFIKVEDYILNKIEESE